ncbi:hypothetical protein BDB01DRAFT_815101 [Pilobolus umbonatus]|nr:hypothetical protein BDB01DRAFT_815101 [Pilobolus umbonatus]
MSVFPKETIKNIGESLGIVHLKDEVATALAQDVEYRVHELIQVNNTTWTITID